MTVLWFTGLSGSGKTTIAEELSAKQNWKVVDGDVVRKTISPDLCHGSKDRRTNVQRAITCIIEALKDSPVVIAPFVSPDKELRNWTRDQFTSQGIKLFEIYIKASVATCQERDVKGLYQRLAEGEEIHLAGVTEPYEEPGEPALICDTEKETVEESVRKVLSLMKV